MPTGACCEKFQTKQETFLIRFVDGFFQQTIQISLESTMEIETLIFLHSVGSSGLLLCFANIFDLFPLESLSFEKFVKLLIVLLCEIA